MSGGTFEIPPLSPPQFDPGGDGDVSNSVNRFRGDLNTQATLVSLSGRNGLQVALTAQYSSSVHNSVGTWNLDAPTGILGLGWALPPELIVSSGFDNGTSESGTYALVSGGQTNALVATAEPWQRGVLDASFATALDAGEISDDLRAAFGAQTLPLDATTTVTAVVAGTRWSLVDAVNEAVYTVVGGGAQLAIQDGGTAYQLTSFQPWRVRYYTQFERWEITRGDGITTVYGGGVGTDGDGFATSLGSSVVWGVRWGNWVGPSTVTHDPANPQTRVQQQYAVAWNRSLAYDAWGGQIAYVYDVVQQPVGSDGLPYTKAIYPAQITDEFGRTVTFTYGPKTFDASTPDSAREYQDPNKAVPNDDPDAYQSRYETQYLQRIAVLAPGGAELYELDFGYAVSFFATLPAGMPSGNTAKRTLTSIQKVMPGGLGAPANSFTYYPAGSLNAGAMQTATSPKGAVTTFTYAQNDLASCQRSLTIQNPIQGGTPLVWFGEDYAIVTSNDGESQLQIGVYSWLGSWQQWPTPPAQWVTISDSIDWSSLAVMVEEDFFVVWYTAANRQTTAAYAFHKDDAVLGSWLPAPTSAPVPTGVLQSGVAQATSGTNYFALVDRSAGQLSRWRWDRLTKSWDVDQVTLTQDPRDTTLFVAGALNVLLGFVYDDDGAPGNKSSVLSLWYLDELGNWQDGDSVTVADLTILGTEPQENVVWNCGPAFAAMTYVTQDQGAFVDYAVRIDSWTADGAPGGAYQFLDAATVPYTVELTQTGKLTIPTVAEIVSQGLVASGPNLLRFNGVSWLQNDNLQLITTVADGVAYWFAYGPDVAVKTENSANLVVSVVLAFDPNADSQSWTTEPTSLYNGAPAAPNPQTRYFPTAGTDVLSWDLDVYERGTSTDWVAPLEAPIVTLPDTIDTTTIVNQGPDFLAYLVETGNVSTKVLEFANGHVLQTEPIQEAFFDVTGDGTVTQAIVAGDSPVGRSTLLTYLPLGVPFEQADQLTLHRFLAGSIDTPISDYPVASVAIDNGYEATTTVYAFDAATALVDPSGTVAKYYTSTVYPGTTSSSKPVNGYTVNEYINGVPPPSGAPLYASVLDGSPLKTVGYDAGGNVVLETDLAWQVFTTVETLAGDVLPLAGAFARTRSMVTTKDGVRREVDFTYDPATGMPASSTTTIFNAEGASEVHANAGTYGYRVYDALAYLNILAPNAQTLETIAVTGADPAVSSSKATTWAPCARAPLAGQPMSCPAAQASLRWLGGTGSSDFDFAWAPGGPPPAAWTQTALVSARTPAGLVQERVDPAGITRSTLFDGEQRVPVASFTNASLAGQQAYYYGFEDYEDPAPWALDGSTPVIPGSAHAGSRSLQIPAGATSAPLTLAPASGGGAYLVSCWYQTPAAYDASTPAGLQVAVSGQDAVVVDFASTGGQWSYASWQVDADAATVTISFVNTGSVAVLVDDVAFASFVGQFVANVYDEPYFLVTAEVGPFVTTTRWVYDGQLRLVARTQADESVAVASTTYLSRQASADAFDPAVPNIGVSVQPAGATLYDRFCNGGDWAANWSSPQPSDWVSDTGWLRHTSSAAGSIALVTPALSGTFFIALQLDPPDTLTGPIGLAVGDDLTVLWDPSTGLWQLTDARGPTTLAATTTSSTPGSSWLLVVTDAVVSFVVDGLPAISYLPATAVAGGPALLTSDPVAFTNVVAGASPEVSADFADGAGKHRQAQAVDAATSIVSATLYDGLGRGCVTTKSAAFEATADDAPLTYRASFASLDWATGIMSGDVAMAYPQDGGYPYSRRRYESSPLGRVVESGLPGSQFAILPAPGNPHTTTYAYGTNAANEFGSLPAGQYFVTRRTDQDGAVALTTTDSLGTPVLRGTQLTPTHTIVTTSSIVYEPTGPVRTQLLPNYYNPPGPAPDGSWIVTETYDMLGHLLSRDEPDAGLTQYVYDARGSRRIWQDPAALADGIVMYAQYDVLGRVLEHGTVPATWDRETLTQIALDEPGWPTAADGAVPQRTFAYDGDGTQPLQLGRLTSATIASLADPAGSACITGYVYDALGRILSETVQAPGYDGASRTTAYGYDNLSRGIAVTYPSGLELETTRDALGRVATIADAAGVACARYTYLATGQIETETLSAGPGHELTRSFAYNSPGWPVSIADSALDESLQYTAGGFGGAAYYSGKIAQVSSAVQVAQPGDFLATVEYAYAYDAAGRLTSAQCAANGDVDADLGIGVSAPVTYDDNGNIVEVPGGSGTATYAYEPGTDLVINTDGGGESRYTYGPTGSVTSASPHAIVSIVSDVLLRRTSSIGLASGSLAFEYDVASRRLLKTTADAVRLYLRTRGGSSLEELVRPASGGDASTVDYVYGPTGLIGARSTEQSYAFVRDHIGSVRAVVDGTGTIVGGYQYLPSGGLITPVYGNVKDAVRYLFGGQELDLETGLYNMGARLYDPDLGRFYAVDPRHQYASPYIFANNNPISFVDPNGEFSFLAFFVGAVLAVVGVATIILTAGADTPAVVAAEGADIAADSAAATVETGTTFGSVAGNVGGSAMLGAGVNGVQYAATHNQFNGAEFGETLLSGAVGGAVSGVADAGISALTGMFLDAPIKSVTSTFWRVAASAVRSGAENAVAALPGQVASNAVAGQKLDSGMLESFAIGFGAGAFTGAFTAPEAAHADEPEHGPGGHGERDVVDDAHDAPHEEPPQAPREDPPRAEPGGPEQAAAAENQCRELILWQPPPSAAPSVAPMQIELSPAFRDYLMSSQGIEGPLRLQPSAPPPQVWTVPGGRFLITDRSAFGLPPQIVWQSTAPLALPWYGNA